MIMIAWDGLVMVVLVVSLEGDHRCDVGGAAVPLAVRVDTMKMMQWVVALFSRLKMTMRPSWSAQDGVDQDAQITTCRHHFVGVDGLFLGTY